MIVAVTKPLFAWDCLEDNPSLTTVKKFLESVPDAKLLDGLRRHRGRGRNDCPVHVAWGVVLLRIALRHTSFVAILAELARNEALGRLIGIEKPENVPSSWNISRFLEHPGAGAALLRTAADFRRDDPAARAGGAGFGPGYRGRLDGPPRPPQGEGSRRAGGDRPGVAAAQRRTQGIY